MDVKIEFYPWARALHLARTGAVDGLMPEYFNPSRQRSSSIRRRFPAGRWCCTSAAATPSPSPRIRARTRMSLAGAEGKRFGVVRGYLNTPVFDAAKYLVKEEANDDATNLRKLVYGASTWR
jgi:polar amino acid transport system substrate-binding protein